MQDISITIQSIIILLIMLNDLIDYTYIWLLILFILSSAFGVIYVCRRLLYQRSKKISLPGPNYSLFQYCFTLKSLYRRSQSDTAYFKSKLLHLVCGLCLIYEKQRIFQISLAMRSMVFFFKPETVEVVLNNTVTNDKAQEYEFLHPFLGSGLITSSGNKWRKRRKLLTPSFHFRILDEFVPVFYEQSCILVSKLYKLQHCSWIDIVPLVTSCTLDIICETAMGVSVNAQSGECNEYVQAITEVGTQFLRPIPKPWLYLDLIFNRSNRQKYKNNLKIIHNFTRKVIKEKKEEIMESRFGTRNGFKENEHLLKTGRKNHIAFLESLLEYHLKDSTITEEEIREEVDTFMFAGHDTTAMTICWTLYCLGLEEIVQYQVHQELDEIFEGNNEEEITREHLMHMKYLECVIKETMRLYSPVPFTARKAKESFDVLGYTIKRGSVCLIFPFMLHRDPKWFPNPEKFDPKRFLPENSKGRHPYAYVPFSAGPRNCIGQKYALKEIKTVLATILRNFKITSKDSRDEVKVTPNIVLRNIDPLQMHFSPRFKVRTKE